MGSIAYFLIGNSFILISCQEHGLIPTLLDAHNSLEERINDTHDGRVTVAHNVWEKRTEKYLAGGTMIITTREATHRTVSTSVDPSKMGRWTSVLLAGKKGYKTRIISVYNPIRTSTGALSVNKQQTRRLRTLQDTRPPRDALIEDLRTAVKQWIEDGKHLIVGMDANEDVRTGKLTSMLREQGLHNAILAKHPNLGPVATYERSEQDIPVDAIMTTINTGQEINAGYFAFGEGLPGDHRTLLMDIPFELIFGNNPPHIQGVDVTPVAVKDPRVRKKFNKRVWKQYIKHGVLDKARYMRMAMNRGDSDEQILNQVEYLIKLTTSIRLEAAKKLRKIKKGEISWSPAVQACKDLQRLWTLVIRRRQRKKVSRNFLARTMKKCNIKSIANITLQQAQTNRAAAHENYLIEVRKAPVTRKKFQEQLAKAIAEENDTKPSTELKNLHQREKQRTQARRVRRIRGKQKTGKVTTMHITHSINGVSTKQECNTQDEMNKAAMLENERRFSRALQGAFMQQPLQQLFANAGNQEPATSEVLQGTFQPPPNIDFYAKLLLEAMQIPANIPKLTPKDMAWTKKISKKPGKTKTPRPQANPRCFRSHTTWPTHTTTNS